MGDLLRTLGLTADRSQPFRDKLWPWWIYACLACLSFVCLVLTLQGLGADDADRARMVGLIAFLPGGLLMIVYAVVARRHQRK